MNGVSTIAVKMFEDLKSLLLATNLGHSRDHPLAGWYMLTILYHDGTTGGAAVDLHYLADHYNNNYLEQGEAPITDQTLKKVLDELDQQANLIEMSPRKIRAPKSTGGYHIYQSYIYRITSSGIEYLSMMQKVVDAENTVTANTGRIDELCQLVVKLARPQRATADSQLYNDFSKMITAYSDVMKGMHKLDEDLDELANDLAFNHGGAAAKHLQVVLHEQAIPAFVKLTKQGPSLAYLAHEPLFGPQVARSQQGSDDLDAAHAVADHQKMVLREKKTTRYVRQQMTRLALSFDPTSTAIDSSLDTIYLLFQTLQNAVQSLSQEYDLIRGQAVDIKALTAKIDRLLTHYQTLTVPAEVPRHLPWDRAETGADDLLDASTMGPVHYQAKTTSRKVATVADNPEIVEAALSQATLQAGLREFKELVMVSAFEGRVDHDLNFTTHAARDEVVNLYNAVNYQNYQSFAPFGRAVTQVAALKTGQVRLQCQGEAFSVFIPSGFQVWLAK